MSKTSKRGTKTAQKSSKSTGSKTSNKSSLKKAGKVTDIVMTVLAFLIGVALLGLLIWAAVKICMGLLPGVF